MADEVLPPCPLCESSDTADFEPDEDTHPNCTWRWRCNACGILFEEGDHERFAISRRRLDEMAASADLTGRPDCPECGAHHARPLVYGLPDFEALAAKGLGDFVPGGCVIHGDWRELPAWSCRACRHEFGRQGDEHAKRHAERGEG